MKTLEPSRVGRAQPTGIASADGPVLDTPSKPLQKEEGLQPRDEFGCKLDLTGGSCNQGTNLVTAGTSSGLQVMAFSGFYPRLLSTTQRGDQHWWACIGYFEYAITDRRKVRTDCLVKRRLSNQALLQPRDAVGCSSS